MNVSIPPPRLCCDVEIRRITVHPRPAPAVQPIAPVRLGEHVDPLNLRLKWI